jgi:hypothetical protein
VRAILASGRPELEEVLLEFTAHATGEQLHQIVRSLQRADQPAGRVDAWAARSLGYRQVDDRMAELRLVLPVEDAEQVWHDLDRWAQRAADDERRAATEAEAAAAAAGEGEPRQVRSDRRVATPMAPRPCAGRSGNGLVPVSVSSVRLACHRMPPTSGA